jgi:gas vesicle protein
MADGYDRFDNEGGGGDGSFVMGLLTGTVLGAGLGMLFAPKAGSDLRSQLTDQAGNLRNTASEGYRRASEAAGEWTEKGRDIVDKAKDAAARGAEEAQRYARDAANTAVNAATTASNTASNAASTAGAEVRNSTNGPGSVNRS